MKNTKMSGFLEFRDDESEAELLVSSNYDSVQFDIEDLSTFIAVTANNQEHAREVLKRMVEEGDVFESEGTPFL